MKKVSDLLLTGADNAQTAADLCALLCTDKRSFMFMVADERKNGEPILSDTHAGYFLPSSDDEVRRFSASMRHRAAEIIEAAEAVERAWRKP